MCEATATIAILVGTAIMVWAFNELTDLFTRSLRGNGRITQPDSTRGMAGCLAMPLAVGLFAIIFMAITSLSPCPPDNPPDQQGDPSSDRSLQHPFRTEP